MTREVGDVAGWVAGRKRFAASAALRCIAVSIMFIASCMFAAAESVIRVGAFPNITHPQAMVGKSNGWFDKAMGPGVKIEWKSFNAGPSAIEALFAGAIDMTYIGPEPRNFRLRALERGSLAHCRGRNQRRRGAGGPQ